MCDWESPASRARIPGEKSFTPATLLDSGALVCNVAEALPSTSLSWIQSNWGNISSLLLGRDPGDGVAANVSHILSQSHGTGATSINLAVRWINVESTHSHMVILAWAPNVWPGGNFWTRLCSLPSMVIFSPSVLALQHYAFIIAQTQNFTCSVPPKGQPLGGRPWGQPQRKEAEQKTGQVN